MMESALESQGKRLGGTVVDISVPMVSTSTPRIPVDTSVNFSFLLKKGNKQQVRNCLCYLNLRHWYQTKELWIPANSSFAINSKNNMFADRYEQKQVKKLVLKMQK